jgi:hypothetical protein
MTLRRTVLLAPLLAVTPKLTAATVVVATSDSNSAALGSVKIRLLALASSYSGLGDADFSKQRSLELIVDELLKINPQPPVRERIGLIAGPWKQVWGPYNYRGSERTVDPEIGTNEIYQVVFPQGYYYNVTPLYKQGNKTQERIALLRGEYAFDETQSDVLLVRFTRYPGLRKRPTSGPALFELPKLVESGEIKSDLNIVPTWIVRTFFGGGALKEVYTDTDMRILYGANSNKFERPALYVMTRSRPGDA